MKKINIIFYILITGVATTALIILYQFFTSQQYSNIKNLQVDVNHKFKQVFVPEGIEDIALIMMAKDEADIILENLVWHFAVGFRKFIVIDNESTDSTGKLIKEFAALTQNRAEVFIIQDPITDHIQDRIITGSYYYVNYIWPEVKWIFPVDADEFWMSEQKLSDILAKIPEDCDAITILRTRYFANNDYYNYPENVPFYEKIPLRLNKLSIKNNKNWNWKIAVRSGQKNIYITQGNHAVKKEGSALNGVKFVSGNMYGLHMTEYTMRSIAQTQRKFSNGLRSVKLAKKIEYKSKNNAPHWWRHEKYINDYGDQAARIRFEEAFILPEDAINDPLPIKDAFSIFQEVIADK